MRYKEKLETEELDKLREQVRLLDRTLSSNRYDTQKRLFGKIATIIEAAIADPEQRKSVKDLISDAIYGDVDHRQQNELELFSEALGFKLYKDLYEMSETVEAIKPINEYVKV